MVLMYAQETEKKDYGRWYKEAKRLYDLEEATAVSDSTALSLLIKTAAEAVKNRDSSTAAGSLILAGNIHQTYQRFTASGQYYHQALAVCEQLADKLYTYQAFLFMGSSFYFSNTIDSARFYFEKASAVAQAYKGSQLPELERLYNSLGAIYYESANYQQAKNYFDKALLITGATAAGNQESLAGIKSNIANCMLRLNGFDSALAIYKSLSRFNLPEGTMDIIKQNMAHAYFETGVYDSALAIYHTLPLQNIQHKIKALNDIGRIYMNRGLWQQAEAIFDSAIAENKKIAATVKNKEEALAYLYRAQLAAKQGLTDEAITWCNESLEEVHFSFRFRAATDLPDTVANTVSPITLFKILQTKAGLLYRKYKNGGQQNHLAAAVAAFKKAIETVSFIKLNFDNDEAKLFFNTAQREIYSDAVAAVYELSQKDYPAAADFIFITENYKGNVLYQNLEDANYKNRAQVPDSIKQREKELKQLLAFYTSRINNNAAEKNALTLQTRLLELQVELSRLQKEYEKDPSFNLYKFRQTKDKVDLAALQQTLDKETAVINFFSTDSFFYVHAVSADGSMLYRVADSKVFSLRLQQFLQSVYDHSEGMRYEGTAASAFIYQKLLLPAIKVLGSCSQWIVLPDGVLHRLPVDALATSTAGDKNRYVVQERMVSYHYSLSLLFQDYSNMPAGFTQTRALVFSPYDTKNETIAAGRLPHLPYAATETGTLEKELYREQKATKQNFLSASKRYPLIHLATHASSGSDTSDNWIQFYPLDTLEINNRLYLHEIYNLDLHTTGLVVLSACETADGFATAGEGLLSLSRAFLYAGADGIVATLWKTEDKIAAYLMTHMHGYLQNGWDACTALQKAKQDLLEDENIAVRYKTPNYWANFIYAGRIDAERKHTAWYLVTSGLLIVLCMLWMLYKKWPLVKRPSKDADQPVD